MVMVNHMGAYCNIPKGRTVDKEVAEQEGFLEKITGKIEKQEAAGRGGVTEAVSTNDMTPAEYKQYIYDKISSILRHPSQSNRTVAIHITEDGFRAMQEEPAYEKWVLDSIKADFNSYDPWSSMCGGSYTIHYFGATKEEYHSVSWYRDANRLHEQEEYYKKKAKDSFWEKRIRHKKRMEELDKRHQAKKWQMAEMQRKMYEREMQYRSIVQRNRIKGEDTVSPERHLEQIPMSYETNVLMSLLLAEAGI